MIDTQEIHPLTDFLRNHEAHIARIKETHTPEVLTVDGRAELVLLDTDSYEALMEQLEHDAQVAAVRAIIQKAEERGPREEISEAEMERRRAVMQELVEETERLGLYKAEAERLGLYQ